MQKPLTYSIGKIKKALIVLLIFMASINPAHARIIFVDDTFENDSETYEIGSDDDAAATNLSLQFGGTNGETISWDFGNTEFDLSDDLNVTGGVTASGTVTANGTLDANGAVTLGDGGDDIAIDSDDWDITSAGALNGFTGADATTENTIEATIFDADAESITGVWEVQDNVAFQFGNDANVLLQYDETTDDRFEISGPNADVFIEDDLIVNTDATVNGTFDANGVVTIGDNGDTVAIDSSDWDISTTGDFTGAGAITADGLITGTAGATISGAATSVNNNSNFATNINTGTSTGAVSIGGGSGTVAIDSTSWDISTAGVASGFTGFTSTGTIDFSGATNILINHTNDTTFTLDNDETGNPDQDIDIVAEQGTENNGTLRYDDGNNQWEISNDGGAFAAITTDGSTDFEDIYANDAGNNLDTSNAIFTVTTGTNDFVVDSNDWNVTAGGALDAISLSDGTATLTTGALNGLTGADATTENTVEGLIFDADAESITGVWEVQDDVNFQFGNDADFAVLYDETTDDRLEINSNVAATTTVRIENLDGANVSNLSVEGSVTGTSLTDGTTTLTGGAINGATSVDATTENTIEATIFDADAESITGVWEVQDNVAFQFGNDANVLLQYDETTDDRLEISGPNADVFIEDDLIVNTDATVNGTFDANGVVTIGDNGDTVAIDSSDWDISVTGDFTGAGAITMDGLLTGTAGATLSGAVINLNANSNFAVNIGTGTSTGAISIGGGSNDVSINSDDWDITSAGALNGFTAADATTEDTVEALIFDADAESITGVWEVQDDTAFQFGTDGDVLIQYDEATDNRLEISGTNADVFIEDDLIVNTDATVNGTFDANGVVTIGDNGDTVAIDSSAWDISAAGAATGFTGITSTGTIDFSGATNIIIDHTNDATFTLDNDNAGAGANVDIIAEQGTDSNGTLRYNATDNRWQISNDGGSFFDVHQAAVFYGFDDTGGQTVDGTEITVNIDNTVVSDSIYSLTADEVTVSQAGLYRITGRVTTDGSDTGGAARSSVELTIQNNTADIAGAFTKCYHRETEENGCQLTIIASLSASDVIRLRALRAGGTSNITTLADGSALMIERIR